MKRRVVITGVGLVTPLGNTVAESWLALTRGTSGVGPITKFDTSRFPVHFAAEVKNFDPLNYLDKKSVRRTGSFTHFALAASDEALRDSNFKIKKDNAARVGTFISSGIGDFWGIEREHEKLLRNGPRRISPYFMASALINLAAGHVSIRNGAKGPNSATATACAAGNHAIGESFEIIKRDEADAMICGGTESTITPTSIAGFAAMHALSTRNDSPTEASRPFDKERDGFVVGEGAGILLLEELGSAQKRDARIYAEIVGYGMSADAYHITKPDETQSGLMRVMHRAMQEAEINQEEVNYINAHGTSTPLGDKAETLAIKKTFGQHAYKLAVSSTKSMTGHLLGGAGGVEAVTSVLAIYHQLLPPTINYKTPDPECDLDYVPNKARPANIRYALSNGFGFGGTNATLIFKRFEN